MSDRLFLRMKFRKLEKTFRWRKILPLNRTSSGILATILSLVDEGSNVVHYLAQLPAHPSIPRSCELVKANYFETDDFDKFEIPENTSLVVVTGSTMDHKVIDEDIFKKSLKWLTNKIFRSWSMMHQEPDLELLYLTRKSL